MAKLTQEVKTAIEKTDPVCIATADINGVPNIVYIKCLKALDDNTIVISDNKFFKTRANLDANPLLAFVVLDADTKKAYQVKGKVKCITEGVKFDETVKWVHEKFPHLSPKAAFFMNVDEVYCGAEKIS
ncbi:MAG: pyridoxamine 5'-phosphate oxidase family protein [Spirochaetia bacterium]|jgi:predicted pyridoxine 5'-phosphate oxidase superfamily flavin-nucleotide-binding protein|nr:pyridoxamine 5'-phosphate oxidase family protein [Spirochaetia bacterium]